MLGFGFERVGGVAEQAFALVEDGHAVGKVVVTAG